MERLLSRILQATVGLAICAPIAFAQSPTTAMQVLKDCSDCPEMVVIPAGSYSAGSSAAETEREHVSKELAAREQPQRKITVLKKFAIGKFEVTRGQFAKFVGDAKWKSDGPCSILEDGPSNRWGTRDDRGWDNPGFEQTDDHPVVCVNLKDVHAYTYWLSNQTGQRYRLPSGAEWEYAARAGTTTARYWGDGIDEMCTHANGSDKARAKAHNGGKADPERFAECDDGYIFTAPVGSFKPNAFGLYDMLGNVLEWTSDCLTVNQTSAPEDTRARRAGDCNSQIDRGGAWTNSPKYVRAATQHSDLINARNVVLGFRLVREID